MKTPFDTALRLQKRKADDLGAALGGELRALDRSELARQELESEVRQETSIASADPMIPTSPYLVRMKARRLQLARERAAVLERVDCLRAGVGAACGSARAIEIIAKDYRFSRCRAEQSARDLECDDLAAHAFIRRRAALETKSRCR
jgi:hypothetical protein